MKYERARLTIRVGNIDRSVDYYTTGLGLQLLARYGDRFAELEAPGLTLMLHQKFDAQPDRTPAGTISLGLQVADIEAARRTLESRGILFEGETVEVDGLKLAFTTDPDGVPIYVAQSSIFSKR